MNRRNLLKRMRNYSLFSSLLPFMDIAASNAKNAGKVVILGAGWGGLSAAKTIKKISPKVEVIIIDSNKEFVSCPMSNWVIGQLKNIDDIMSTNVINCDLSFSSSELMELMNKKKIRHIPIIEKDKLLGIVSIGDVVKRLIEIYENENLNLKNYINS